MALFGFLNTSFGKRIRAADFIRSGAKSANAVLTTRLLLELLRGFIHDLEGTRYGPAGCMEATFGAGRTHAAPVI
jgi:hypothetical protein